MAIMVYKLADGSAYSYIPDNLTIPQAQASGQLSSNAQLAANGFGAAAIAALSPTTQWNPATLTTITVPVPASPNIITTFDFIMAFTAAELAAIRASVDNNVQQFLFALQVTQGVNLTHTTIGNALTYLVNHSLLTATRAQAILATVVSGAT